MLASQTEFAPCHKAKGIVDTVQDACFTGSRLYFIAYRIGGFNSMHSGAADETRQLYKPFCYTIVRS